MDLSWLGKQLEIDGEFISAVAYGSGHINETFAATYEMGAVGKGTETRQCRYTDNPYCPATEATFSNTVVLITRTPSAESTRSLTRASQL